MLSILGWTLCGLIVGILATRVVPCRDRRDWTATVLFGISGTLLGEVMGRWCGGYALGEATGMIMALIGALVLVVPHRLIASRQTEEATPEDTNQQKTRR